MSNNEADLFRQKYIDYIAQHGDPFEVSGVAFSEDDLKKVKRFFYLLFGFFSICTIIFFVLVINKFPQGEYIGYALAMVSFIAIGFFWGLNERRNLLERNVKTVIKGIITRKGGMGRYKNVQISVKEGVFFFRKDYSACNLGDIVSVEFVKVSMNQIGTKVTWIGKI